MLGDGLFTVMSAVSDKPPRLAGKVAVMIMLPPARWLLTVNVTQFAKAGRVTVGGKVITVNLVAVLVRLIVRLAACGALMVAVMMSLSKVASVRTLGLSVMVGLTTTKLSGSESPAFGDGLATVRSM